MQSSSLFVSRHTISLRLDHASRSWTTSAWTQSSGQCLGMPKETYTESLFARENHTGPIPALVTAWTVHHSTALHGSGDNLQDSPLCWPTLRVQTPLNAPSIWCRNITNVASGASRSPTEVLAAIFGESCVGQLSWLLNVRGCRAGAEHDDMRGPWAPLQNATRAAHTTHWCNVGASPLHSST
ncbi:hypothetical protein OBBRIDRAFT_211720 [Obba rivulosa]|uniref:Uncharacterized protein n=1 Tax=Obba rivulosa TaxID=1052685 RepID=A0A8E2ALA7_9APHY|nr:hypothetical protein OBBRIDRAFT_211720 [Obba rivulosa]